MKVTNSIQMICLLNRTFSPTCEYIVARPNKDRHIIAPNKILSKPENNVCQNLCIPTAYTNYRKGAKFVLVFVITSIRDTPSSHSPAAISLYTDSNSFTVGASK